MHTCETECACAWRWWELPGQAHRPKHSPLWATPRDHTEPGGGGLCRNNFQDERPTCLGIKLTEARSQRLPGQHQRAGMFRHKRLWQADFWLAPPSSSWAPGGGGGAGAGDRTGLGSWTQGRGDRSSRGLLLGRPGHFHRESEPGSQGVSSGGGGPKKPSTLPRFSVEQTGDREGLAESGPRALRPRDPLHPHLRRANTGHFSGAGGWTQAGPVCPHLA